MDDIERWHNIKNAINTAHLEIQNPLASPEILDNISDIYVEQGVRFKSVGGETSPKSVKNIT